MRGIGVLVIALAMLGIVSCSSDGDYGDNYLLQDDEYGVYTVKVSGGDLGNILAKYDLINYPYIAIEGTLKPEDFEMLKYMQKTLMYLNLEKVNIEGSRTEEGKIFESNKLYQDYMLTDGKYTFPLLKTIILPKKLEQIGEKTFLGSNITKFVTYSKLTAINDSAFAGCKMLSELNLPNSVRYIGDGAFKGCVLLTDVVVPSGVDTLYDSSFDNRYVKTIHIKSKIPPVLKTTVVNSTKSTQSESRPTIYVPFGSKDNYKSNPEWNKYTIIEK